MQHKVRLGVALPVVGVGFLLSGCAWNHQDAVATANQALTVAQSAQATANQAMSAAQQAQQTAVSLQQNANQPPPTQPISYQRGPRD